MSRSIDISDRLLNLLCVMVNLSSFLIQLSFEKLLSPVQLDTMGLK